MLSASDESEKVIVRIQVARQFALGELLADFDLVETAQEMV